MRKKSLFITFEGIDGSGKTTQVELLANYLKENLKENFCEHYGHIIITREPGGTRISEKIREIILDKDNKTISNITETLLYAASRSQHVEEVIKPALESGNIIICDRFIDSSMAYQGAARGVPIETVRDINKFAVGNIFPDITFLLDIDPSVSLNRRKSVSTLDRLESENLDFFQKVSACYRQLAELYPQRIISIDASLDAEVIHGEITKCISKWFNS